MDKYQFVDDLIERIRGISVDSIIGSYIHIHQRGGIHKDALCPFHNDKRLGSFKVTPSKGIWKCFSCDIGGDAIKFVRLYYGLDYIPAIFKIGLEFGLITQSDYDEYYKSKRYSSKKIEHLEKKYVDLDVKRSKELEGERASEEVRDAIYRMFIKHSPLSEAHEKHLLEVRKLEKHEIEENMFFTFPTRRILTKFFKDVEEAFGSVDILGTIPGFYKEKETDKYTFVKFSGIGIPIRNTEREVIGIQIRKDDDNGSRYIWFGSTFANGDERYSNGTSAGSPIDVIIPDEVRTRTVFITEGKFKGISIAKNTKSVVIDVAGVTTWKGVLNVIKSLNDNQYINNAYSRGSKFEVKLINLAYDADLSYNPAVFEQQKKMAEELMDKEKYPVFYLYWDSKVAKGIDDLYLLGRSDLIKRYSPIAFNNSYQKMLKLLLEENPEYESIVKVPHDLIESYFDKYMELVPLDKSER